MLKINYIFLLTFTLFAVLLYTSDTITPIFDIQFTTNPGFDGTYPSPLVNQTVTVQGIVTATGFDSRRIFISDKNGGAWSSIAIEPVRARVSIGDMIEVQGRVSEIMGMTVLTQPQNIKVISRNNNIPQPISISVHEALTNESYESCLVKLTNLSCKRVTNGNSYAVVDDGTASIEIGNAFKSNINNDIFVVDVTYNYIIGIVNFSHNKYSVHPRNGDDILKSIAGTKSSSWSAIKSMYR